MVAYRRKAYCLACLQVDWNAEQACFETFLRELARFYAPSALNDTRPLGQDDNDNDHDDADMSTIDDDPDLDPNSEAERQRQQRRQKKRLDDAHDFARHQLEHVLFPAMRRYAKFPKDSIKHITELADVKNLYRIFERC